MQAHEQAHRQSVVFQPLNGPIELDPAFLEFVGGGTPKGTWSEESLVASLATGTEPTPKGTW
ncbi:hypothetical protein [Roseateles amylovorans]|jgi:hypothetical protein|uniref:Uncharacterized protein n=1 Tax=Roseateles amylovorans TaxID=2978473 RepID=A0ABY6B2M7_9BURK|nr:hypothetical protein [Roseateles amylovorans]UXH78471.1 hypothetical protein N4261_00585 [Roseateles amylovorans]